MIAAALRVAAAEPAVGDMPTLRDFLTQDVCLDKTGMVILGVAPLPGDPRCAGERDLRPGERLPYHKHDHASPDHRAAVPVGYQRHDSFPVETMGLGTVVEQSFDFGAGEGARFGVFDPSDGGDVAVLMPGTASIGATQDAITRFALWVGECQGPITAAALAHSWLIAEYDTGRVAPLAGETIARLNLAPAGHQALCPSRFNAAYTSWRVVPFRYRTGPGQGEPVTLTTLISEHYGGAEPATAAHLERFYFTRELGGTRWERWENAKGNREFSAAKVAEMATWFAGTGRCSAPEPPGGGATMLLVECREWTQIVMPADPAGDRPGFLIDHIRAEPDTPALFAPPSEHN